jgi:thiol-disulfide isomerase/thioredoxin
MKWRVRALSLTALLTGAALASDAVPAIRPVTPEQFTQELAKLRGQIVMLNVWATWCVPCLKEIPDLLQIEAELASQGFALLGLSIDEPGDAARVESFRHKHFSGFRSLLRDSSDLDAVVSVLDPAWNEVVPTTYLIGRNGRVLSRIQGKKTLEQFRAAALDELGASAGGASR